MFIDYNDINTPFNRSLVFSFYGFMEFQKELIPTVLDFSDNEYSERIKVNSIFSLDDLPQISNDYNSNYGKLNLEWVRKTTALRPSVLTLIYDAKNKPNNLSWTEFENNICTDIYNVRKTDCYKFMTIVIFIISPNSNFSLESSDEKEKVYSIKKQVNTKIYYTTGIDSIKSNKKIQETFLKLSLDYYKQAKKDLKLRKASLQGDDYDSLINVNMKLAFLSLIKNKRISSKYFEEALVLLMRIDPKKLSKTSYVENKAVATLCFRAICKIRLQYEYLKNLFNSYINYFLRTDLYKNKYSSLPEEKRKLIKEDVTLISEYYWLAVEFDYFSDILLNIYNNNINYTGAITFNNGLPGYYCLKSGYNYQRILNSLKNTAYTKYEPKFDLKKFNYKKSSFLGKQPSFILLVDPLNPKEIPFDEELQMKLFVEKNNITQEVIFAKMIKLFSNAQANYNTKYDSLKNEKEKKNTYNFNSIFAFNKGTLDYIIESNYNTEKLLDILKLCINSSNLDLFPLIKLKLLEKINEISLDSETILGNLIQISNYRMLDSSEKLKFYNIINNEAIHKKFVVMQHDKNSILNFKINLINPNPELYEKSTFEITVNTLIENLSLKKVKLFFSNPERNITKDLKSDMFNESNNNTIIINHTIFVKESDKNLKITNITVELNCNSNSTIVLDYIIPQNKIENILSIKNTLQKSIEFKFEKDMIGYCQQNIMNKLCLSKLKSTLNFDSIVIKISLKSEDNNLKDSYKLTSKEEKAKLKFLKSGNSLLNSSVLAYKQKEDINNNESFITSKINESMTKTLFYNQDKNNESQDKYQNQFLNNDLTQSIYQSTIDFNSSKIEKNNGENEISENAVIESKNNNDDQNPTNIEYDNNEEIPKEIEITKSNLITLDQQILESFIDKKDIENLNKARNSKQFDQSLFVNDVIDKETNIDESEKEISNLIQGIINTNIDQKQNNVVNIDSYNHLKETKINAEFNTENDNNENQSILVSKINPTNVDNSNKYFPLIHKDSLFSFYWVNEENVFVENENLTYEIKNVEESSNFNYFVKFAKSGEYKVIIKIQYKLSTKNLNNDMITMLFKDEINFSIKDLFSLKQEIHNNSYFSQDKKQFYFYNEPLNISLILQNLSNFQVKIQKMFFEGYNDKYIVESIIDNFNQEYILQTKDELSVPITLTYLLENLRKKSINSDFFNNKVSLSSASSNEDSSIPAWIKILWRDDLMNDYIKENSKIINNLNNLYNELIIPLEKVNFKLREIKMELIQENSYHFNKPSKITIRISNLTNKLKRLNLLIDFSDSIIIHGFLKKKFVLPPNEIEEIDLHFIPIIIGPFKFPIIKIVDKIFILENDRHEERKVCSYYLFSDYYNSL